MDVYRAPPGPTVQKMFGEIADRYDLLNRLLSLSIDRRWAPEYGPADRIDPTHSDWRMPRSLHRYWGFAAGNPKATRH